MTDSAQVDAPSIDDDDRLWRRIPKHHVIFDENTNRYRPTSNAFRDSSDHPVSVYVERIVLQTGRTAADVLAPWPGYSLVSLTAGTVRKEGLEVRVELDPAFPGEPAHAVLVGNKSRAVCRRLANAAEWVILTPPQRQASQDTALDE